jgi:cation:H+ antiporter
MWMPLNLVLAVLGLALLAVAADQLVLGAARLATRLRVSAVVVGVVVIGLGTSAPEFLVSGIATASGQEGLAMGNLVGSNIINMSLILGVGALIAPVTVRSSVLRGEAPLSVAAVVVFAVFALLGVGVVAGAVLALLFTVALLVLLRLARIAPAGPLPADVSDYLDVPPVKSGRETVRAVLGLIGTLLGAHVLVTNAAAIATGLGAPPTVVGFTLVAFGTSLPELVTTIQAQRRGEADLLVGNLLGSNLFNSLGGGAIVGFASRSATPAVGYPALAAMVAVNMLAWLLLFRGYRVSRPEGALLLAAYALSVPLAT